MEITFLGHSSFKIKGKTTSVITDPFDPNMVGLKFPKSEADIVTVSHQHNDHNNVEIIGGVKKVVDGPGEYEIGGISIIGTASYHDASKGAERGGNTIYSIEVEGVRITHLGDLGHTLTEEKIKEIGPADILMIPVGGEFTIGPSEAVEVVHAINPTIILPMHYQMPGLKEETFSKLAPIDTFLSEIGIKVEKLPKLVVKGESLVVEDQKVVLLEKR